MLMLAVTYVKLILTISSAPFAFSDCFGNFYSDATWCNCSHIVASFIPNIIIII